MSIYMNIFHGRTWDDDQKESFFENGDGRGSQGPQLKEIRAVHFMNDNLYLSYPSSDELVKASESTSWAIVSLPPFGSADVFLKARFTDDLMCCYDRESNRMIYFGDYHIENQDDRVMKMHLRMEENYAKGFSVEMREIILEKVTDLHFTYGTYTIGLENEAAFLTAKVKTGWYEGVWENSLELPIGFARKSLLVQSTHTNHVPLLYGCFELTTV